MNSNPVVLDLETQLAFHQVGGYDPRKLKVSVAVIYDYRTDKFESFRENELSGLFAVLEHASFIIGYNVRKFDLAVLAPYYLGKVEQFETLDMLEEVEKVLGHRVALDDLVRATLGVKKSGHGLLALEYYKRQEWDKLENYCRDDVKITRDLYEYGLKNGVLYLEGVKGKREIEVDFDKKKKSLAVSLSLPF